MTDGYLPANAEAAAHPWPYAHSVAQLDRCWDAYMLATVTDGHPLADTFIPLAAAGVQPYQLSAIFDLTLTVAGVLLTEAMDTWVDGPPGTVS